MAISLTSPDPAAARRFKSEVFGHFARAGAAFGHATRVEIIDVLAQGERSVESLAGQVGASVASTSRHLQILHSAGLVRRRVEGALRVYQVADPSVVAAYRTLVGLAVPGRDVGDGAGLVNEENLPA